jgi:hypothetical protein
MPEWTMDFFGLRTPTALLVLLCNRPEATEFSSTRVWNYSPQSDLLWTERISVPQPSQICGANIFSTRVMVSTAQIEASARGSGF